MIMAVSRHQQATTHPLVAYNYRVIVGSLTMRFTRVEGLVWERSAITYRDGLSFLDGEQISPYRVDNYTSLTLHQGVVANDNALLTWLLQGDARVLQVMICQATGDPVLSWRANRAIPLKLTPSTLDAATNDVLIDSLELRANGWTIEHPI
ncbi:MAG: phage tail protein [Cyanobacteriota bacterium]|nr:phage tail protein [Cyanobacteriota bacterium]